jgi:hypothetical protein
MILVRTVFNAKQGKIRELVDDFKHVTADMPNRPVILTDLSGPMNTLVMEGRHDSLAAYEKWRTEMFKSPMMQDAQRRNADPLFESGSIEFYTIEQD